GVFMPQSTEWSISLDRSRVNLGYVSGLLGDRGWEMFAVETRLQPGAMTPSQLQTNWYFKRPGSDKPHSNATRAEASMSSSPAASTSGAAMSAAAAAPAASAAFAPAAPAASTAFAPTAPTPSTTPAASAWS